VTTLCLSGGGFRATLFHAGVISALREMELLPQIRNIVSVSGGSIVAAHATLNWDRYTHYDPDVFRKAIQELIQITTDDVRGRIVRRWVLLGAIPRYRRIPQLTRFYDTLLCSTKLEDLAQPGRPNLYIASTSLVTGERVYFTADGLLYGSAGKEGRLVKLPQLPIAYAVAASSAFPPMFPPVILDPKTLQTNLTGIERLTDAGVFDNLGLVAAGELASNDQSILVSDASASFTGNSWNEYSSTVSRTIRTTDILMSRVAELDRRSVAVTRDNLFTAAIYHSVTDAELKATGVHITSPLANSKSLQHWVALVRTDLDVFNSDEIRTIFRHGYSIAAKAFSPQCKRRGQLFMLAANAWDPTSYTSRFSESITKSQKMRADLLSQLSRYSTGPAAPSAQTPESVERALKRASARKLGLWNKKDPVCWILAVLVVVAVCGSALAFVLSRS